MRVLPSLLLAIALNVLLILFIYWITSGKLDQQGSIDEVQMIEFVRVQQEPTVRQPQQEEPPPEEPPPPDEPPPPPEAEAPKPEQPAPQQPLELPVPEINTQLGITGGPYLGDFKQPERAPAPAPVPSPAPVIVETAVPTYRVPPVYPARAMRAGIEGVVTVEFTINTDGTVSAPKIIQANPPKIFDRAVLRAITKWKFEVRKVDGKAIARRVNQDIKFTLDKGRR